MEAQEMFEELRYEFSEDEYEKIYSKKLNVEDTDYTLKVIGFNKNCKTIDVSIGNGVLTLNELKAINQQCKELGWL